MPAQIASAQSAPAQLALYGPSNQRKARSANARPAVPGLHPKRPVCASCQACEARYGFRSEQDDPLVERPRTLCFECFRLEMQRRQEAARAVQARLPLGETLEALGRRRRRAQIAARRALGL